MPPNAPIRAVVETILPARTLVSAKASMSDQPKTSEISKFFVDYARLFDARDGANIATYYHVPSMSMRADASVHVFQTGRELQDFFQAVTEKYHAEGQRGSRFVNLDVKPVGSNSVLATMEWQMLDADEGTIRTWRQSYNLICRDGRWQILVSTIHI
jgi:hypothetical protein